MVEYLLYGKVLIDQPTQGFRCGIDSVLVASIVPKLESGLVLDMGCGVFSAGLCYARFTNTNATIVGVEKNTEFFQYAQKNIHNNILQKRMRVIHADIRNTPFPKNTFDAIVTNPPFERNNCITRSKNMLKSVATIESTVTLDQWVHYGLQALKPYGIFCIIHKMQRLDDLLHAFYGNAGDIHVIPVQTKADTIPKRVLMRAEKGKKPGVVMHKPLIVRNVDDTYNKKMTKILEGKVRCIIKNTLYSVEDNTDEK